MGPEAVDVDALVAQLRARVEERRRRGDYPPGLEDRLAVQTRFLLHRRVHGDAGVGPDVAEPLTRARAALPLARERIPLGSDRPGGETLHRLVAALVEHQTAGMLDQVQAFAEPVTDALAALTEAVERLTDEIHTGLRPRLHAVLERQAVEEIDAVQTVRAGTAPNNRS